MRICFLVLCLLKLSQQASFGRSPSVTFHGRKGTIVKSHPEDESSVLSTDDLEDDGDMRVMTSLQPVILTETPKIKKPEGPKIEESPTIKKPEGPTHKIEESPTIKKPEEPTHKIEKGIMYKAIERTRRELKKDKKLFEKAIGRLKLKTQQNFLKVPKNILEEAGMSAFRLMYLTDLIENQAVEFQEVEHRVEFQEVEHREKKRLLRERLKELNLGYVAKMELSFIPKELIEDFHDDIKILSNMVKGDKKKTIENETIENYLLIYKLIEYMKENLIQTRTFSEELKLELEYFLNPDTKNNESASLDITDVFDLYKHMEALKIKGHDVFDLYILYISIYLNNNIIYIM
eukprot:GHVL01013432.1.p1 GENE.GHVL01013432.1~~GHVL01013432.1.p1  ORF type:complete len:347 (+),score=72.88 GHVL01013432.1:90-1130(+)